MMKDGWTYFKRQHGLYQLLLAINRFDFSKDWVLRFQDDSNLVLCWSSGTNGHECTNVYKLADALVINCEKEVKLIK